MSDQSSDFTPTIGDQSLTVALFENFSIRRVWHQGEWWYSLVDCMVPLSGSKNKQRYWTDLTIKLREEMAEEILNYDKIVVQLRMPTKDGKMRRTDCANTAGILRILQSIPSPKAEPFKRWLAAVGAAELAEMERTDYRLKLARFDQELYELVSYRGIKTDEERQRLRDANFRGLYDVNGEVALIRKRRIPWGIPPEEVMDSEELATNGFHRALTAAKIKEENLQGQPAITTAAFTVGRKVRQTLQELGRPMPEDLPLAKRLSRGEWVPEEELALIDWDTPEIDDGTDPTWIVIEMPRPHETED